MPRTPDYFPGQREEESLLIISGSDQPSKNGEITYVSGSGFKFYEEGVIKTLSSSVGITENEHLTLRQLIHLAENGPFEGFDSGTVCDQGPIPFPTSSIWYVGNTRLKKIVEQNVTYNSNRSIATEQWRVYNVDGTTVKATVTDTISYDGIIEISRTRVIT